MAVNPVLQAAYDHLLATEEQVASAEELISVMRAAGEDVGAEITQLAALKTRRDKLKSALEAAGVKAS